MIFILKYVSRVAFKGDFLGGACQFWGNPYLNSTTVLFDNFVFFLRLQIHLEITPSIT